MNNEGDTEFILGEKGGDRKKFSFLLLMVLDSGIF